LINALRNVKDENIDNARRVQDLQKIQDELNVKKNRYENSIRNLDQEIGRLEKV